MPGRFNLTIGITRQRLRAAVKPRAQFLIAPQTVRIHHQLFKSSAEPTFHPTGRMKNKICPSQHSRMHGIGTFIGRLRIFDFACGQRSTTAQRQARSPRHLTNGIVRQDGFRHAKGWCARFQAHGAQKIAQDKRRARADQLRKGAAHQRLRHGLRDRSRCADRSHSPR